MGRAAVGAGSPVVMGSMNSPMLVWGTHSAWGEQLCAAPGISAPCPVPCCGETQSALLRHLAAGSVTGLLIQDTVRFLILLIMGKEAAFNDRSNFRAASRGS